ncbi:DUF2326 domain-containing protein [Sporolactobacillus pectinivorans]|uniref:DUF2326 domain-containing protein n=1 Tax=Sporolactobacillus pectinivorans TaxID=1591408 RepID=UPI000C257148|nr:DUF2326 domain-containing protein [Sporolactobacillus pectinivorans]
MLRKIECSKFTQKEILFHSGLNTIVGDELASNSIGKSNMLMIIDFVFGGRDYISKNKDVVVNLGHHSFKFEFDFTGEKLYFIRSTEDPDHVSLCNEKYLNVKVLSINQFTSLLQKKYNAEIEDLTFRDMVGRYFRVYGKENLNEKKPIQYFEKETARSSIIALLKLFNKYTSIKELEMRIKNLKEEKKILEDAAKKNLIPKLTKKLFKINDKKIDGLNDELNKLKKSILTASIEIEALVSKEVLSLQSKKSDLTVKKNLLENRLKRTLVNIAHSSINLEPELSNLKKFFPDTNVDEIKKIDSFHSSLTKILEEELKKTKKELNTQIKQISDQISSIDTEINSKLSINNAPKFAIDRVIQLASEIKQLKNANGYYTKKIDISNSIKSDSDELKSHKQELQDEMCNKINDQMSKLNNQIYKDKRRAPTLQIKGDKYLFNTDGDTGTGTAFANLITFDLTILELTCLPAIAHDLPLLKNIENPAFENIVKLYNESEKQIFIAIDKINSYNPETAQTITKNRVLQLSKDKLLFIKNWKYSGE